MYRLTSLLVTLLLAAAPPARGAQTAAALAGHWEGAVEAEGRVATFEVDLATTRQGEPVGTISVPAQNVKGLPLTSIRLEGKSVAFYARTDQPFNGVLSADGHSISGEFNVSGHSIPFTMTRTGDPRIAPQPTSAPIGRDLEGTWNATLNGHEGTLRLVLTMTNRADGTATGRVVNLDEGSLELPARITRTGSSVTLEFNVVGASYTGILNDAGTELAGTYTQGPVTTPLTFQRAAAADVKRF
jgi:hypothetical protein